MPDKRYYSATLLLFALMMLSTLLNEYVIKENIYTKNTPGSVCSPIFFLTREDILKTSLAKSFPPVTDGDILITFSSHTFTYRHGHAAIVTDAKRGITLESTQLGSSSSFQDIKEWNNYPGYAILRLSDSVWQALSNFHKKSREDLVREMIAYAKSNMVNIPYTLSVGILSPKSNLRDTSYGTNCSHLVWQCYKYLGIDLDSDGGMIVTPHDIYESPYVTVVKTTVSPLS